MILGECSCASTSEDSQSVLQNNDLQFYRLRNQLQSLGGKWSTPFNNEHKPLFEIYQHFLHLHYPSGHTKWRTSPLKDLWLGILPGSPNGVPLSPSLDSVDGPFGN